MIKKTLILSIMLFILSAGLYAAENAEQAPAAAPAAAQSAEPEVKVKIAGNVELSANYSNYTDSNSTSNFNALTNFGFNLTYLDWISAKIVLEIESSKTYSNAAGIIDETSLKIGNTDKFPLFAVIGKFRLPFQGEVGSVMFTDAMTVEFGELKIPALQLALKISLIEFGVGVFKTNQSINKEYASNHIHDGYLYLKVAPSAIEGMVFNFSLISNTLDGTYLSTGYSTYIGTNPKITHRIPAFSAAFTIPVWKLKFTAEMTAALRKVEWKSMKKPYTWFFEVSIKPVKSFEAGLRFENSYSMDIRTKLGGIVRFIWGSFNTAVEIMYLQKDDANKTKGFSLASITKLEF